MDEGAVYPYSWALFLVCDLLLCAEAIGRCGRCGSVLSVFIVVSRSGECVKRSFSPVGMRRVVSFVVPGAFDLTFVQFCLGGRKDSDWFGSWV